MRRKSQTIAKFLLVWGVPPLGGLALLCFLSRIPPRRSLQLGTTVTDTHTLSTLADGTFSEGEKLGEQRSGQTARYLALAAAGAMALAGVALVASSQGASRPAALSSMDRNDGMCRPITCISFYNSLYCPNLCRGPRWRRGEGG